MAILNSFHFIQLIFFSLVFWLPLVYLKIIRPQQWTSCLVWGVLLFRKRELQAVKLSRILDMNLQAHWQVGKWPNNAKSFQIITKTQKWVVKRVAVVISPDGPVKIAHFLDKSDSETPKVMKNHLTASLFGVDDFYFIFTSLICMRNHCISKKNQKERSKTRQSLSKKKIRSQYWHSAIFILRYFYLDIYLIAVAK